VSIRKAQPEEASALRDIIHQANRHWGYPENWIDHSQSDFVLSATFICSNEVYVAEESGRLLGFYSLATDQIKVEQLWIAPAYLGTGIGKELFLHAMEKTAR
jgi:N-acetylglutamate synthase-like GNAT family acetyltransferase